MIPSITSLSSSSCFSINQTPFSLLLFFITIHLQFQSILVVPMETPSEHVCYIHCSFCNTILAVSVPCTSLFNIVTVRCGHCTNLLSVNMGSLLQTVPIQDVHQNHSLGPQDYQMEIGSSSKCSRVSGLSSVEKEQPRMPPIRPPEKRQRVPSAYNRFIKEEIQRIKAGNPEISHREAFSMAAKNWAHFPHIHFGLTLESNKQTKTDEGFVGGGAHQMAQNFQ